MLYRITGGVTFGLIALQAFGVWSNPIVLGIFAVLACIGLLAGI